MYTYTWSSKISSAWLSLLPRPWPPNLENLFCLTPCLLGAFCYACVQSVIQRCFFLVWWILCTTSPVVLLFEFCFTNLHLPHIPSKAVAGKVGSHATAAGWNDRTGWLSASFVTLVKHKAWNIHISQLHRPAPAVGCSAGFLTARVSHASLFALSPSLIIWRICIDFELWELAVRSVLFHQLLMWPLSIPGCEN